MLYSIDFMYSVCICLIYLSMCVCVSVCVQECRCACVFVYGSDHFSVHLRIPVCLESVYFLSDLYNFHFDLTYV